jgi:hypothetical protein
MPTLCRMELGLYDARGHRKGAPKSDGNPTISGLCSALMLCGIGYQRASWDHLSSPRWGRATTPTSTRYGRRAMLPWPDSDGNCRTLCDGTSRLAYECFCGKGRKYGLYSSKRMRTRASATPLRLWSRSRDGASPPMRLSSRRAGNAGR